MSGSFDETVRLWDACGGVCIAVWPAHSDPVTGVAFSPDDSLVASCSYDGAANTRWQPLCLPRSRPPALPGYVRLWDPWNGACLHTIETEDNPPVASVRVRFLDAPFVMMYIPHSSCPPQFSANGKYLLLGSLDSTLRLWEFSLKACVRRYTGHESESICAFAAFAAHGAVVTGGEDRGVHVWDGASERVVQVMEGRAAGDEPGDGHTDTVVGCDAHPQRRLIASSGMKADGTIKLWQTDGNE